MGEAQSLIESLSRVERHQAFSSHRTDSPDKLLALSWEVATQPTLYKELIPNPYSSTALRLISQRFPEADRADVIKAAVLAEPKGSYDRNFRQLSREQQREELYKQIDVSAETTIKLARYFSQHAQEFWSLPQEQIYSILSNIAFGTSDPREVEQKFAQSQRRGFRLAIVNFIEDMQTLKPYQQEFHNNARVTVSRIFNKPIEGKVEVESLPIGFVIYLDEDDYDKINPPREIGDVPGATIAYWPVASFPQELAGRVILLNRGGHKKGFRKTEELQTTKEHELKHTVFANFAAEKDSVFSLDTEKALDHLTTLKDHRKYAEELRRYFTEYAKNEVIAFYGLEGAEYKTPDQLGGDKWLKHLEQVRKHLWLREDLNPEQKVEIYNLYNRRFIDYLGHVREYQWIAKRLFKSIPPEKAEALLLNTSVDNVRRLGRYFGVSEDDIPNLVQQDQEQAVRQFSTEINELTKLRGNNMRLSDQSMIAWHRQIDWDVQYQIKTMYPREAKVVPFVNTVF